MFHLMEYWTCPECKTAYGALLRETVKIQLSTSHLSWGDPQAPPSLPTSSCFCLPQTRLPPLGNTQDFEGEGKSGISPIHGRVKPWVNVQQMPHPVWGPWGEVIYLWVISLNTLYSTECWLATSFQTLGLLVPWCTTFESERAALVT